MTKQKIGLFGGSFNPIHFGHVYIARQAIKVLNLDQIWLLFCRKNPLKNAVYQPCDIRMQKALEMIGLNRKIKIINTDDIYTYKTINYLKKRFCQCKFIWIMGIDSLKSFHNWEFWFQIAQSVKIAVFDRKRQLHSAVRSKSFTRFKLHKSFILITAKRQDISSTQIRNSSLV